MNRFHIPFWKDAPFVRIIIPFIVGIATGYYLEWHIIACLILTGLSGALVVVYTFLKLQLKFRLKFISGINLNFFILSAGSLIAAVKNPFKNAVECLPAEAMYIVALKEPLSEKKSSWKSLGA